MSKFEKKVLTAKYEEQKLKAYWTLDCQRKKDYDTNIISFSCRMYPDFTAYCHLYLRNGQGEGFFEDSNNETRDYREGDYFELASIEIIGKDETDTKSQVERWCNEKYNKLIKELTNVFGRASGIESYVKIDWR